MKRNHTPIRTCIITRKKYNKFELLRFIKNKQDFVEIDINFNKDGRGASILKDLEIAQKAIYSQKLEKALKLKRKLTKEQKDKLFADVRSILNNR